MQLTQIQVREGTKLLIDFRVRSHGTAAINKFTVFIDFFPFSLLNSKTNKIAFSVFSTGLRRDAITYRFIHT